MQAVLIDKNCKVKDKLADKSYLNNPVGGSTEPQFSIQLFGPRPQSFLNPEIGWIYLVKSKCKN